MGIIMGILFVSIDSLLVRWRLNFVANPINICRHDPLSVATFVYRSDCVHMALGALQR